MLYQSNNPHGGDVYNRQILLDYSANTNPYGTPQGILDAMCGALSYVHQYPDPYCRKLVQAIADFEELPKEYILCGNGAAELIYAYCEAIKPRRAVEVAPTFSEYAFGLAQVDCQVERYMLHKDRHFQLDENFLGFLETHAPEAIFLCTPNNPTGQLIPSALLERILNFCKQRNIRLFLDECFLDLSDDGNSLKRCLANHPQLFILKAFTKSYGMAGVRLGYCLCADSNLLYRMAKAVQPWNVSLLAQAAGVAALGEGAFLEKTKALIRVERQWLKEQLEQLGFWVAPSSANYLLFWGDEGLHTALLKHGIAIRSCDNYPGLSAGWYRIAVRQHMDNEQLLQTMKLVLGREP